MSDTIPTRDDEIPCQGTEDVPSCHWCMGPEAGESCLRCDGFNHAEWLDDEAVEELLAEGLMT